MNVLFIAAEPRELQPLLSRCSAAARVPLAIDWAWTGTLNGDAFMLATNGAGTVRAALAVTAASSVFPPDAIVSTGFCGALSPELSVAEIVTGSEVAGQERRWSAQQPRQAPRCRTGVVRTVPRIAQSSGDKLALRNQGGDIVEMEAAGVAEAASKLGVSFYCIRAVTDLAAESFAIDFNAALREDGHFDTMRILRESLRSPAARLPELLRLRNRCVRAAQALGDFFAECRF